jgi:hypothetical protein
MKSLKHISILKSKYANYKKGKSFSLTLTCNASLWKVIKKVYIIDILESIC